MFIDNSTISELVATKRAHPEYLLVSANGINNPALSWVHYHLGAIRPYLPEYLPPTKDLSASWRASELPQWKETPLFNRHEWFNAPYENHRWLPLGSDFTLDGTPITTTAYSVSNSPSICHPFFEKRGTCLSCIRSQSMHLCPLCYQKQVC